MNKTYLHIYKQMYQDLYRFCVAESSASKKALEILHTEVSTIDDHLVTELYEIILSAVNIEDGKSKFFQKAQTYEKALDKNDYWDQWWFYSILFLIYQYIYPDTKELQICTDQIKQAEEKLTETDISCQFKYEHADYAIRMHIKQNNTVSTAYKQGYSDRSFKLQNRSFMTILKGYSSSTPFFYPALKERFHHIPIKGGGIYIKWHGTGIVLDPGINFLENFHIAGLSIKDIDIIIVTHNHIDHNGDLAAIDDLAYQLNKKDISLYMDKQTEAEFSGRLNTLKDRHGIDLTMFPRDGHIIGVNQNILLEVIPTEHIVDYFDKVSNRCVYLKNTTYAVKLSLIEHDAAQARIGFTSDTRYLESLSTFFADCDYVIANMSETNKADYESHTLKENHLGYSGCLNLIKECTAKRTPALLHTIVSGHPRYIISEFWAGKGDIRKELVKCLRKETNYDYIYPGDIGMCFFLDQATFLCNLCGAEQRLEQLKVIRPDVEYSPIFNICSECILD